ncbi:hypothetical protein TrispH2_006315 [Trichoplax sp. H2]|nr:hypothetical protein TrispH2_006315 [Trichoplax sp. H2]|eukprot:RDD41601.1 hypothetical protein TrispH2_006315 [Trichoplax sp. H2]
MSLFSSKSSEKDHISVSASYQEYRNLKSGIADKELGKIMKV